MSSLIDAIIERIKEHQEKVGTESEIYQLAHEHIIGVIRLFEKEYNNGWISCKKRLPEKNQEVLICHSDYSIGIDRFEGENIGFEYDVYNDVIAWQQLPEPPIKNGDK